MEFAINTTLHAIAAMLAVESNCLTDLPIHFHINSQFVFKYILTAEERNLFSVITQACRGGNLQVVEEVIKTICITHVSYDRYRLAEIIISVLLDFDRKFINPCLFVASWATNAELFTFLQSQYGPQLDWNWGISGVCFGGISRANKEMVGRLIDCGATGCYNCAGAAQDHKFRL
jgi:hypothetical protein